MTQCQHTPKSKWRTLQTYVNFQIENARWFGFVHLGHAGQILWDQNSRLRGTAWKDCVRTSIGRIAVGTTFRKVFRDHGMGECSGWEWFFLCTISKDCFCPCMWTISTWKVREVTKNHVGKTDETNRSSGTNTQSGSSLLGVHAA